MRTAVRETSIAQFHAHRAAGLSSGQREAILDLIKRRGGDWSIGEIAEVMGWQKSTVSARINELLYESKQLVEMPKRKDGVSGVLVRPVGLPMVQADLF